MKKKSLTAEKDENAEKKEKMKGLGLIESMNYVV
jgi:hypothetical protein